MSDGDWIVPSRDVMISLWPRAALEKDAFASVSLAGGSCLTFKYTKQGAVRFL